jgi:D-alanine-D-alanine ligase
MISSKKEPPGVVVLYNDANDLIKGEPRDLLAEQGVVACARAVVQALGAAGYRVVQLPIHSDVELALTPYPPTDWMIFNLGEGLEGRLFEEARIAWAMEAMGYQFTGAGGDALARTTHKARTKTLLAARDINTPPWWLFRHPDEVVGLDAASLTFPLIVKPVAEDASIGVGPEAVAQNARALRERVAYIVDCYRQAALAEAFIVGREFNIALWGSLPELLPLAEVDFSAFDDPYDRIVSFAAKWEQGSFEYHHTPIHCPATVDASLRAALVAMVQRAWDAIGCQGYARVDLRVSADDVPYVVEVNCNPDLSPDAGFYRAAQAAGYDYQAMVVHILEIARSQSYGDDTTGGRDRRCVDFEVDDDERYLYADRVELRRGAMEGVPS